ncbi:hypothetical protein Q31a_13700 [Aureliella helgolandensis]|uniref:Uncharacterized protein n=1 Tax=Aureliella helgolandensis TaxID=2527968 RepID=A0A518G3C6_9BACT|nr:hypothetical protein Q31a_13700 [Aureliella helgolandensis]
MFSQELAFSFECASTVCQYREGATRNAAVLPADFHYIYNQCNFCARQSELECHGSPSPFHDANVISDCGVTTKVDALGMLDSARPVRSAPRAEVFGRIEP